MPSPVRTRTATVKKLLAILKEAGVSRFESPDLKVEFAPAPFSSADARVVQQPEDPTLRALRNLMPGLDPSDLV